MALSPTSEPPPFRIRGAMGGSDDLFSPRGLDNRAQLRSLLEGDGAVALEIGFGHGHFLLGVAEAAPDLTVIGVEYQGRWVRDVGKHRRSWPLHRYQGRWVPRYQGRWGPVRLHSCSR